MNVEAMLDDMRPKYSVKIAVCKSCLRILFANLPDRDVLKDLSIFGEKPGFLFGRGGANSVMIAPGSSPLEYGLVFPDLYSPADVAGIVETIMEQHGLSVLIEISQSGAAAIKSFAKEF
jgi:hypothetical protein